MGGASPEQTQTHLLLGVAVAAHGPQVPEGPPQQDDEEPPKESDHGGGEESPPHALAVAGHVGRRRDEEARPGDVDRRVRDEFLSAFRHRGLLVAWQPLEQKRQESDSGALGCSGQRPLMPQRLAHVSHTPSTCCSASRKNTEKLGLEASSSHETREI